MYNIDVIDGATSTRIKFQPGDNLLAILRAAGVRIRTGCQQSGACALCLVYIRKGLAGPVTVTEELQLGHRLALQMRLACQVIPAGDLVVELVSQPDSRVIPVESSAIQSEFLPDGSQNAGSESGYGLAVDIGTTNVSMSVFRRKNGKPLAARTFSNPQGEYGTDVIARILKAAEAPSIAENLQNRLLATLKETLQEMTATANIGLKNITAMGIVGNTAMLTLFTCSSYRQLLDPQYWDKPLSLLAVDKQKLRDFFRFDRRADIEIIDPLAGFVGSDLLAGITAIRLLDQEPGTLFIDFGTNTEIALWDGQTVWVTSAAGGPAFEGNGMSHGCAAIPGAIFKVNSPPEAGSPFMALSVDNREAVGICGSGYVDIIATLLDRKTLDSIGRLPGKKPGDQEISIVENPPIKVTKQDIDTFQRAKAAVAAGIRVLSRQAAMSPAGIKGIYVAGNFGRFLDISSAQRVGLLPSIDSSRIHLCPNAALRGCADILLSQTARNMLAQIRSQTNYRNLAFDCDFESSFMKSLYLMPY